MEYLSKLNFYFLITIFIAILLPLLFLKFIHPVLKKIIENRNKNLFKNLVKLRFFLHTRLYTFTIGTFASNK